MVNKNLEGCQKETEAVTNIMLDNYNKVLDREGKLSDLDERADELRNMGLTFSKTTKTLAQKKRWENKKYKIILGLVVAAAVVILLAVILYFAIPQSRSQDAAAGARAGGE
uniref:Vesicle associated membrane protein 5 n=1 Tax=Sphenodon punctatus TaxID=8508 RepID=A0A8D0G5R2_SPHPU